MKQFSVRMEFVVTAVDAEEAWEKVNALEVATIFDAGGTIKAGDIDEPEEIEGDES